MGLNAGGWAHVGQVSECIRELMQDTADSPASFGPCQPVHRCGSPLRAPSDAVVSEKLRRGVRRRKWAAPGTERVRSQTS